MSFTPSSIPTHAEELPLRKFLSLSGYERSRSAKLVKKDSEEIESPLHNFEVSSFLATTTSLGQSPHDMLR